MQKWIRGIWLFAFLVATVAFLAAYYAFPPVADAAGILHDPYPLIPVAAVSIIIGMCFIVADVITTLRNLEARNHRHR
ncbi:hypothetical protein A9B99_01885 [Mangrovibacter phragmitis]|uniref:Uncharacterized protein n=1 Tax=Mangrovibacter phragmitis TaxID=1691903 RepID=A0A1B7L840_9ENTR|nr:hypothetical protein A9B99_01885 [Mangrovibacter phragmitis]